MSTCLEPVGFSVPFLELVVSIFSLNCVVVTILSMAKLVTFRKLVSAVLCPNCLFNHIIPLTSRIVFATDCRQVLFNTMVPFVQPCRRQFLFNTFGPALVSKTVANVFHTPLMPVEASTL